MACAPVINRPYLIDQDQGQKTLHKFEKNNLPSAPQ